MYTASFLHMDMSKKEGIQLLKGLGILLVFRDVGRRRKPQSVHGHFHLHCISRQVHWNIRGTFVEDCATQIPIPFAQGVREVRKVVPERG